MAHDDIIRWKHFPRYWPFVKEIHQSPGYPSQRPLMRSFDVFLCALSLTKSPDAGDLRRHAAHCDVTIVVAQNDWAADVPD